MLPEKLESKCRNGKDQQLHTKNSTKKFKKKKKTTLKYGLMENIEMKKECGNLPKIPKTKASVWWLAMAISAMN